MNVIEKLTNMALDVEYTKRFPPMLVNVATGHQVDGIVPMIKIKQGFFERLNFKFKWLKPLPTKKINVKGK